MAKKPGTAFVRVSIEGLPPTIVQVNVSKSGKYFFHEPWISEYDDDEWAFIYGESAPIEVWEYSQEPTDQVDLSALTIKSLNKKVATVSAKGKIKAVGVGKTKISVSDADGAESFLTIVVKKAPNTLKVKAKTATAKASVLKKGLKTLKRSKVLSVTKAKGKVTYIKKSGNAKIKIAKKGGKVTIKKGLKKGTYKVKVKIKAAGTKNYKAKTLTRTFKIKVK